MNAVGALVLVGEVRGDDEGLLGLGRVPQIAFHVGDRRAADLVFADVGRGELLAGAEIGVHRPLAARREQDHRARRRRAVLQPAHAVVDADLRADRRRTHRRVGSAATLPTNAARPPKQATPAAVLADAAARRSGACRPACGRRGRPSARHRRGA